MDGVNPGPACCNATSTENTSASTRFSDFFKYGKNSARISDSEKGSVRRKALVAPISDMRFCTESDLIQLAGD